MKKRSEIPSQFKWDIESYCKNNADCEKRMETLAKRFPKFEQYKGKLSNKNIILKCLQFLSQIEQELSVLSIYAFCKLAEDNNNIESVELSEKISNLETQFSLATNFIVVELSNLDVQFLNAIKNDKEFANFSRIFSLIIRNKEHILSEKEEKILAEISSFTGGFDDTFSMFDNADIKFDPALDSVGKKFEVNMSTYSILMNSTDVVLRKNAYKSMMNAYGKMENFLATNYANSVKMEATFAKIKKYKSNLDSELSANEFAFEMYDNLLSEVNKNNYILQNYLKAKKKFLGINDMVISDISAPIGIEPQNDIVFEKGFEIIKKALAPLGEDYLAILDKAKEQKWMDLYDNEGKDAGQFQVGAYGKKPLVFLRYNDNIDSISTMGHELGHAIHTYYSNKNQPFEKADYKIFLAEIASTVNETFLSLYLIKNSKSVDEKIYNYDQFLDTIRATIYRQTLFAEFEKTVFEKYETDKVLSKKFFQETYENLNKKYYGADVKIYPETKYEYSRIPHFYNSFYVYKYATGLLSAILIVKKILAKEPNAKENYIKFLSSGNSLPPLEVLKIAGVDLTLKSTFDEAFDFINNIEKEFENLSQKKLNLLNK